MPLERDYQAAVIKRIKRMLPGCVVIKNDSGYQQGFPDWTIFYGACWGVLEIKREMPKSENDFEANQLWFIDQLNHMSFSAFICPENEEDVLRELQYALTPRRPACVP